MSKEQVMDYVMTTPGNPNKAVLSGMLDSIAEAGGGGDEYLGIHTVTVNVTFDTSEVDGGNVSRITNATIDLGVDKYSNPMIIFAYGDGKIPVTEIGTPTQMILPISDEYPIHLKYDSIEYETSNSSFVVLSEATVISGSATGNISSSDLIITGDCSVNFKVTYQE